MSRVCYTCGMVHVCSTSHMSNNGAMACLHVVRFMSVATADGSLSPDDMSDDMYTCIQPTCMDTCIDICTNTCIDICTDTCIDIYTDTCIDICTDTCIDKCEDMCVGMCIDTCIDMCIDKCIDKCIGTCIDMCIDILCRYGARQDLSPAFDVAVFAA